MFTNTGTTPRNVTVRLTVTDTNGDAVGPESTTKSMVITVQPAPGGTHAPAARRRPSAPDSTAPVVEADARQEADREDDAQGVVHDQRVDLGHGDAEGRQEDREGAQGLRPCAGRHTLTIKLSKSLRRLLRHRRTATLTLAATDDAGNGTTLKRTLKLRAR